MATTSITDTDDERAFQVRERFKQALEAALGVDARPLLTHVNNVYIADKDGLVTLIAHVDDRAVAAELEVQGELVTLALRERFGEAVDRIQAYVTVGRFREPHPYLEGRDEEPVSPFAPSTTFRTFVIGDGNREAASWAAAVTDSPGQPIANPLYIYGGRGLGKTLILLAIHSHIAERAPELKVSYVDIGDLVSRWVESFVADDAARSSGAIPWESLLETDVLLVDDVQALPGCREEMRERIFALHNHVIDGGGQVVFAADRAPKDIGVSERHQARLNAGMVVSIGEPGFEARLAIVKSFAAECRKLLGGAELPAGAEERIASEAGPSARELKAAVAEALSAELRAGNASNPGQEL